MQLGTTDTDLLFQIIVLLSCSVSYIELALIDRTRSSFMLLLMLDPSDSPALWQSVTQPMGAADACLVRPLDQQL